MKHQAKTLSHTPSASPSPFWGQGGDERYSGAMRTLGLAIPWALALLFLWASPAAARLPNVVMIISDDQGWTDFGFMGNREIRTPNLDRLAAQSAVFSRGYVPTSLCRASLATLITGLYPHQHKL